MEAVSTLPRKKSWQTKAEVRSVEAQMAITRERVMAQMLRLRQMHGSEDDPMSQEEAAHTAGVSARTWQRWEAGDTVPYARNLSTVAEKFGLPLDYFETEPQGEPLAIGHGREEQAAVLADQMAALAQKVDELTGLVNILIDHQSLRAEAEALEEPSSAAPAPGHAADRRRRAA
jgi:transcriptional regulator with XRE-family HTH domain